MEMDFDTMRWGQVVTSNAVLDIREALDMFEKAMAGNDYELADEHLDTIVSVVAQFRQYLIVLNETKG